MRTCRTNMTCGSTIRTAILSLFALIPALGAAKAASLMKTNGTVLAANGLPAPGIPGVTFGGTAPLDIPYIADGGLVLFRGRLIGAGVTALNERAFFTGTSPANLTMMIRSADPAPGLPGITLNTATAAGPGNQARMSADGRALWTSSLSGVGVTTANDTALFGGFAGSQGLIAREGDPAPGTAGALFSGNTFSNPSTPVTGINRSGSVLFMGTLSGGDVVGTTNNTAWYTGTPGSLTLMVRKGATVLGSGETASNILFTSQMDDTGRVLYDLTLGAPATTANDNSLWLYTPGSGSALLVREGDSAPGTSGATFNNAANTWAVNVGPNAFTRTGYSMMLVDLMNGDVSGTTNNQGLYRGEVGFTPTLVARKGSPAPATDANFNGFGNSGFSVNASGAVVFSASLTGGTSTPSNNSGIWSGQPGSLQLIVRQGDPAPGTAGASFGSLAGPTLVFNDAGRIVFTATLTGGDATGSAANSIYAYDPAHGLFLLARGAESLEVAPGVFKTVALLGFFSTFNNGDGAPLGLGHDGKIVMRVGFTGNEQGIATLDLSCYPPTVYYQDSDGDGFGNAGNTTSVCNGATPPAGYVTVGTDCNDGNGDIHPGAAEVCNAADDDCDGSTDEGFDVDGDMVTTCGGDCDDTNPGVHPGASDASCNTVDEDCDGTADDEYAPQGTSCGIGACAATGSTSCVGGQVQDSCTPGTPGPDDVSCNGIDDNCDGTTDEGYAPLPTSCGTGACAATGSTSCVAGQVQDSCTAGTPGPDDASCNGIDNNCDGMTDEGYAPLPTSCGIGACGATGSTACIGGQVIDSCIPGSPTAETCNGIDDDCDGSPDDIAAPSGYLTLMVANIAGETQLSWSASTQATAYDVVAGDVQELHDSAGQYGTLALSSCLSNDLQATSLPVGSTAPAPGTGRWFIVRPINCGGDGTYDEGGTGQQGSRDAEIAASSYACP